MRRAVEKGAMASPLKIGDVEIAGRVLIAPMTGVSDLPFRRASSAQEPDREARLAIVLDHFREALAFYGERLGLKTFRKHLGWYVEQAPWPACPAERRAAKARLCRLETPAEVEAALEALWLDRDLRAAA
jgi:tRNA-dihydrouridine synthase